jgi:hypothetical protein
VHGAAVLSPVARRQAPRGLGGAAAAAALLGDRRGAQEEAERKQTQTEGGMREERTETGGKVPFVHGCVCNTIGCESVASAVFRDVPVCQRCFEEIEALDNIAAARSGYRILTPAQAVDLAVARYPSTDGRPAWLAQHLLALQTWGAAAFLAGVLIFIGWKVADACVAWIDSGGLQ